MSDFAEQPRERIYQIDTAANPVPSPGIGDDATPPLFVLSPRMPGGERVRGFAVTLVAPAPIGESSIAAVADTGGFTLTFYRFNVTAGIWGKCEPFTGAAYLDQLVCYDLGGGAALYLVVGNVATPGKIDVLVAELP